MLFVFSKEKIISFAIAFSTIAILLLISATSMKQTETIPTSSNVNMLKRNIIYGD